MKAFFRRTRLSVSLPVLLLFCAQAIQAQDPGTSNPSSGRERLSLDRGWLFHEGDIPFPVVIGHQASYDNAKAGSSYGAASPEYDDSSWKQVDLPHDWAVEQPFDPKANISQGYRARGMGWYRKYFRLDPADRGKHLEVQLDASLPIARSGLTESYRRATGRVTHPFISTSRPSRATEEKSIRSRCKWMRTRRKAGGMRARDSTAMPGW